LPPGVGNGRGYASNPVKLIQAKAQAVLFGKDDCITLHRKRVHGLMAFTIDNPDIPVIVDLDEFDNSGLAAE
jgi:hypothetical protein